jgi:hypothetical protein
MYNRVFDDNQGRLSDPADSSNTLNPGLGIQHYRYLAIQQRSEKYGGSCQFVTTYDYDPVTRGNAKMIEYHTPPTNTRRQLPIGITAIPVLNKYIAGPRINLTPQCFRESIAHSSPSVFNADFPRSSGRSIAGLPATKQSSGTSLRTRLPAPITAFRPIFIFGTITAPAPTVTPSPT